MSLFGSTPSSTPSFGGFGFGTGGSTTTTGFGATPASTPGFSFGGTPASSTPSLFGTTPSAQTPAPAPTNTGFGTSLGLGSAFGGGNLQTSSTPTLFQSSSSTPTLTSTTPAPQANINFETTFSELPPQFASELAKIQGFINDQKSKSQDIEQRQPDLIVRMKDEIETLSEKLNTLLNTLTLDIQSVNSFKTDVSRELKNAEVIVRTLERLKSPMVMMNMQPVPPPSSYFLKLMNSFEIRMQQYNQCIEEIEKFLSSPQARQYSPSMLQDIMRNQHEFFLSVAGQVAMLSEIVSEQKTAYLKYRQQYFNDKKDPFEEAEKRLKKLSEQALKNAQPPPAPTTAPTPTPTPAPTTTSQPPASPFGAPTSSLFSTPSASSTGTSLWGSTSAAPTPAAQQPNPAASSFGSFSLPSATTPNPANPSMGTPAATPGLGFNTSATPTTSITSSTSGLFGGTTPAATSAFPSMTSTTPSLFGATPSATPTATTSTFGAPATGSPFGFGTTIGGPTALPENPNTKKKGRAGARKK